MRRAGWVIALVVAIAGVCWLVPPFHLVPLERAAKQKAAATFNPAQFAETFWTNRLLASLDQTVKAEVLLPAIQSDPAAARKRYARSLGLSESYTYFVSGVGRVVTVTDKEVLLEVSAGAGQPEIALPIGLIFGNAVRDGTGLINVNDYPNSQDFNAISAELNRIIETRVLPKLRELARVGVRIRFAGCAEINDAATDLRPLRVVPVLAEVE